MDKGRVIQATGAIVGVGGAVMLIAGVTRLHSYHKAKWGIIAPVKNEIGLAYNF